MARRPRGALVVVAAALALAACGGSSSLGPTGTPLSPGFHATGSMTAARMSHAAALLRNGKALIAGGTTGSGDVCLASAELYDEASGTFSPTGSMAEARYGHIAALLEDGRVLVAGGWWPDHQWRGQGLARLGRAV
jgi:hypothetical protein